MTRALPALLVLVLALPVRADPPPPDLAPVELRQGEPSPADGILLVRPLATRLAANCHATEIERNELRVKLGEVSPVRTALLAGGVGLMVGAVVGLVVGLAARRTP